MVDNIVTVENGKLQGKTSQNIDGKTFYSFQGIPYAKPPIGNLRFKAPQPPNSWAGIRDATKEGDECYARHMIFKNLLGAEDCLTLNVYTPQLPTGSKNSLKPVMVWIHGGAFTSGSNKTDIYGPDYLLTEDIILVTINYRLGILGFLALDDTSLNVPGNAGLKDMVMALKWVQKNISSFGGDQNNVTIFGESAGGAAVHYLVLSPMAKGLFHKAIAQSGCALTPWSRQRETVAAEVAEVVGFQGKSDKELLDHLMDLPVEKLFEISEAVPEALGVFKKRRFGPVIEKSGSEAGEAFLSEEPIKIIKSGKYNQVPFLLGFTTREGMLMELKIFPKKPGMPEDFEMSVPHMLNVTYGSEKSKIIADKIKKFYYGTNESADVVDNFYLISTDNWFLRDIVFAVKYHATTSTFPVYLYQMSIETSINLFKKVGKLSAPGVCHGDDISYLFKTKLSPDLNPGSIEDVSVRRFVKLWTNFARSGNPNSNQKDVITDVIWEPVQKNKLNYLDIGEKLSVGVNPEPERMAFWTDIFKINSLYD